MSTQLMVTKAWQDRDRPIADRVEDLVDHMTVEEKVAQLIGVWVGADASGGEVAPHQATMIAVLGPWDELIRSGLGQLTRPFGSAPIDPATGIRSLAASQATIVRSSRFGIPAQVHEECLAGFATWRATAYPVPLSWGASFDPELVARMAGRIGSSMRSAGVHQGLAPVLDVTRDYRWGRTEETIGEDPYLVGTIGAAYVRGLEGAGVVATLKHFAGYSASRAGRNLGPVSIGPRELADAILPPFEMALRLGGARSVMHSYTELDGVPSAADPALLTGLLRERWGFDGTVVADYFGIRFLETLHGLADGPVDAARLALRAGVDVELPTVDALGPAFVDAVRSGAVDPGLVDRALRRVLTQKAELGLLDADWDPLPGDPDAVNFDDAVSRDVALELARESVVLLANPTGVLPLSPGARVAVVGPLADDPMGMLGCYSFPAHVGVRHPEHELGLEIDSVRTALAARRDVTHAPGCEITGEDRSGVADAVAAAEAAEVCVVVLGDRAGLFGRGTSGEGCDATDLRLPGVQQELLEALLGTGTPIVLVLLTGRPYALGAVADRAAAVVQAFFPGQFGGRAVAEVLTGETNPSGRLPVSVPADPVGPVTTYLSSALGRRSRVSTVDPTPVYAFGHGLSYTEFRWEDARVADADWRVDASTEVTVTVRNVGDRAGTEVVQLYLHDPVAQVALPVQRLVGYARVPLAPGEAARVTFTVPADVTSFTGIDGRRIVEPGAVELRLARSSAEVVGALASCLVGTEREVDHTRELVTRVRVCAVPTAIPEDLT